MASQDYQLIEEVLTDGDLPIAHYVNKITGLNVFIANIEMPLVKGDICLATEAFDDDGLPHTLEHLVFMGSEDYPYKGVLDRLANRCLASGTNACTDTDNTNYTLCTAGSEGFLSLLPIYIEHLLFPTLTESAYATEVHHVDGKGEDAGVVYAEMQARENSGDSRCHLEMLRCLYPGKCGYKSETGGLLKNLRESTTNAKCQNYHKEFYHTRNMCLIVTGPVKAEDVFEAIKPIEDKVVSKKAHEVNFQRPWQSKVEPLTSSCTKRIEFPADSDEDGLVYIGFRGPEIPNNYRDLLALTILLDYLNSTAIAPFQRDFVESEEPWCSSISHNFIENSTSIFYLAFENVGKGYLDKVSDKLNNLLSKIRDGKEEIDMQRLQTIISRKIVRILSVAESSPHSLVAGPIIGHFLYGQGSLSYRVREIPVLEEFTKKDSQYWCDLIGKYMIGPDARHACIVGEASPKKMKEIAEAEEKRLIQQKEKLSGELENIAENLKKCVEQNDIPAPTEMLNSISIPSVDNIRYHSIERFVVEKDLSPVRIQYDCIKTNFVSIHLLMNTSNKLSKSERLYLPLMTEIILECPIKRGDIIVPYEKIVAELFADTISYNSSIGLSSGSFYSVGAMSMLFGLGMQVELNKYAMAVKWFIELLFQTVFTPERIKTVATRMSSDISQYKRSGGKVTSACFHALTYASNSNQWAANFVRQKKFLKNVLSNLKTAQEKLTSIRDSLTEPDNMLIHIATNKNKMDVTKLHLPWLEAFPEKVLNNKSGEHIKFESVTPCYELFQPVEKPKAAIIGVGSVESNYLYQVTRSINSPLHPDLPALYVLLQYLTQLEGPLWRQIRGLGLSYNYEIDISPSEGLLSLILYKSTQLIGAYEKAKQIVENHLNGTEAFDDSLFQSAKSCLIFEFIKREKSAAGKSMQSLVAYLRGLNIDYNKDLINSVAKVSINDLKDIGVKYLKPLFEDEERRVVICCHPSKIKTIKSEFENNLEVIDLENPILVTLE